MKVLFCRFLDEDPRFEIFCEFWWTAVSKFVIKQEILYNNDNEVTIRKFNTLIILKSEQYITTESVKAMEFWSHEYDYGAYYGIKSGEPIAIKHIQSIICYTDFSLLSASFTSTFRKSYSREGIKDIKERNSCYIIG